MAVDVLAGVIADARRRQRRRRIGMAVAAVAIAAAVLVPLHPWRTQGRVAAEHQARRNVTPPAPTTPGHGPGSYSYRQAVAAGIIKPFNPATAPFPVCPKDPRIHTRGECMADPRDSDYVGGATQTFPPMNTTAVGKTAVRYVDRNGWSLVYPRRFHARAFDVQWVNSTSKGASFSNFAPAPSPGDVWDGNPPRVPRDGVLLELTEPSGDLAPMLEARDATFPLSLAALRPSQWSASRSVRHLGYGFQADGRQYSADVWIGTRSPAADRRALAAMLASIRFRRLHTGQRVDESTVLGRASAYPPGSITRFDPHSHPPVRTPFYLVHDPSGFRALGWPANTHPPKYAPPCNVHVDQARHQFYCPHGGRWDALGQPINQPPDATHAESPAQYSTSISWDDHVLVSTDFMSTPMPGKCKPQHPRKRGPGATTFCSPRP